ncbi:TRAP transporter small permease subunit [Spiribacter halobius]|uniref:TRAP transporter small permease protein n=1 Tax=Sediminicurvatus halobius TaxID=2182432 RepID=A0A2U2N585_9GAMM|nr:TRAP transporter small permease [Spiribacter halobius]PWG64391.1 C4-dicarboxylate ABC transporter permease [Spiribacter halobius]UEX79261.1 TRAP transporter small permease [Spiribacter halobius]
MANESETEAGPQATHLESALEGTRTALDRAVCRAGRGIAWLIFIAMAISVAEVLARYGFNNPTSWVHESVVFLVAVIFAFGGPAALAKNRHIRVRVIYDYVSPARRRWMDVLNDGVTLLFCVAMSYAAYVMFWRSTHDPMGNWTLERSGTSWNPPIPSLIKGAILVALAVMTVQALLHFIQSLRGNGPGQREPTAPARDTAI